MSLGLTIFTVVHVLLSLIGILAGFVVVYGLITAKRMDGWTATFLWTTILTSVTGFLFPFHKLLPSHILGILSLIALAIAVFARYRRRLAGGWNRAYAISAVIALYFNVFVLVAQLFQKVPALKALAPTQSEPPFKIAQLAVLIIFVLIGIFSAVRFRSEQLHAA
ncbi:MAG TPA: hypothetical protein VGI13_07030 [Candidatus Acidoferrum sp.]